MILSRGPGPVPPPGDRGGPPPNPWAPSPCAGTEAPRRRPWKPDLVRLWGLVSTLWLIPTVIRMDRVWTGGHDWSAILARPITWYSLLVPPVAFAVLLAVVGMIARRRDAEAPHDRPGR